MMLLMENLTILLILGNNNKIVLDKYLKGKTSIIINIIIETIPYYQKINFYFLLFMYMNYFYAFAFIYISILYIISTIFFL